MGPLIVLLCALGPYGDAEAAVERGTKYLIRRAEDPGEHRALFLLTMIEIQVPGHEPVFRRLLKEVLSRTPESTRDAALEAMALLALDPIAHRNRLAHCAQFLIDNQAADGRWGVGEAVDPPEVPPISELPPATPPPDPRKRAFGLPTPKPPKVTLRKRRDGPAAGDGVNSRWAAWGLLACHRAGWDAPEGLSEKAAAAWRSGGGDAADVVSALCIHLFLSGKDYKMDRDVLDAVERLGDPERPTDPCSLVALKIALGHFGSEKRGGRDWWPQGIKILTEAQKDDGSWGGVLETCAALRYLHTWNFLRQEEERLRQRK